MADRRWALEQVLDRTEGKSTTRSENVNVSVKAEAGTLTPRQESDLIDELTDEELDLMLSVSAKQKKLLALAAPSEDVE